MPRARMHGAKIYYVHLGVPLSDWEPHLRRAADLGFNCICVSPPFLPHASGNVFLTDDFEFAHPVLGGTKSADELVAEIASRCGAFGLRLLLDIQIDRVAAGGAMARSAPRWFGEAPIPDRIDPRQPKDTADAAYARFDDPYAARELSACMYYPGGRRASAPEPTDVRCKPEITLHILERAVRPSSQIGRAILRTKQGRRTRSS